MNGDHIDKLQKVYQVYKERYQKAETMGIGEDSKFYEAMLEIKCRYVALYFAMELIRSLEKKCLEHGFQRYCFEFLQIIMKGVVPCELMKNEHGQTEYFVQRTKLSKKEEQKILAYKSAKQAYMSFLVLDYDMEDKGELCELITKSIIYILQWILIVREIQFPVNRGSVDKICIE